MNKKPVPQFVSEMEEAAFWAANDVDDYDVAEEVEIVIDPVLMKGQKLTRKHRLPRGYLAHRLKEGTLRIELASTRATTELEAYVTKILKEVRNGANALVTDLSRFSDFGHIAKELVEIGERLGIELDPTNDDDWWIVKVAKRMRDQDANRSS